MITQDQLRNVVGATAYDRDGDKIGKVGQVYYDDATDQPTWVTVNTGFFGTHESFVPVSGAENFDIRDARVTRGLYQVIWSPASDAVYVTSAVGRPPVGRSVASS